ncbi:MAG: HAD family hydrolase [Myxococcales bacterium]
MTSRRSWPSLELCLDPEHRGEVLAALEGPPGLAAFDADGTLWDGDVGEALLEELGSSGQLVAPHPPDPFAEYARRLERDPAEGFAYAAAVMAGLAAEVVAAGAERIFRERFRGRIFEPMRELVLGLRELGWEIFLVSASNRWSVAPGARELGVAPDRIIAVDVELASGRLTDRVARPVPTLHGKPELLRRRVGRGPDLAFGNSRLDLPLLESARLPVAVGPRAGGSALLEEARTRGWASIRVEGR